MQFWQERFSSQASIFVTSQKAAYQLLSPSSKYDTDPQGINGAKVAQEVQCNIHMRMLEGRLTKPLGAISLQAEAKRFLGALAKRAEMKGSELFSIEELFDMADTLELNVPDMSAFIDMLNDAGKHDSGQLGPEKQE